MRETKFQPSRKKMRVRAHHLPRFALLAALAVVGGTVAGQEQTRKTPPGVQNPGIRIPIARLKPDAVFPVGGVPDWLAIDSHVWVSNKPKDSVSRMDPAKNAIVATYQVGKAPCSGLTTGFGFVWVPLCGDKSIAKVSMETGKVEATLPVGIGNTEGGIATGAGSVWIMTDAKGTLARIDPSTNKVVAEMYVASGSYGVAFGENAVWVTSTEKSVLARVDPRTNLVAQTIPVGPSPRFLAVGEGSVWTLNQGDGSISRVDVATNKVVATIAAGLSGGGGEIAVGEGSVWVTLFDYPLTRIDPLTNAVAQQFVGEGGDAVRVGHGSVWLSNLRAGNVWRLDPKRVEATQ
jgi:virginiamycin B lyase